MSSNTDVSDMDRASGGGEGNEKELRSVCSQIHLTLQADLRRSGLLCWVVIAQMSSCNPGLWVGGCTTVGVWVCVCMGLGSVVRE